MANNSANYNVNMRFTADTGQAKQQLRDLQSSLDTLMNQIATKNIKFFDGCYKLLIIRTILTLQIPLFHKNIAS